RWIKGSAILGCVGCLVGHLFMFLVGGKTPDQSVHLNLTTTDPALYAAPRRGGGTTGYRRHNPHCLGRLLG
ncbi:hypothetical protein ACV3JQ_29000, partial [Klebsiella pneumoniae]